MSFQIAVEKLTIKIVGLFLCRDIGNRISLERVGILEKSLDLNYETRCESWFSH